MTPAEPDAAYALAASQASVGTDPAAWLGRCLALDGRHLAAMITLATVLAGAASAARSRRLLQRALALQPAHAAALGNLALAERFRRRTVEAARRLRRVLAASGIDAATLTNLGAVLWEIGTGEAAWQQLRRAGAFDPGQARVHYNAALIHQAQGYIASALTSFQRVLALDPTDHRAHSNLVFCLAYRATEGNAGRTAEAKRWGLRHARSLGSTDRWRRHGGASDRRLRLGYVSSDLRLHPVARNLEGLIRHHDRSAFEVFLYSQTPAHDEVSDRLASLVDHFRDQRGQTDGIIAEQIHRDGIDILILLASHTGDNRPLVAAYRPAPIQISAHDIGTTGIAGIDYWLTDRVLHPPQSAEGFTEALIRLPCFYLHAPPAEAPGISPLPAPANGFVTYASFNNPAKLSRQCLTCWAEILRRQPRAVLALKHLSAYKDARTRERLTAIFAAAGVGAERLLFKSGAHAADEHLRTLAEADIALDPFPFNGSTTSFEALWMGLPVVSLAGDCFVARVGASLLTHIEHPEWIATDHRSYVRIAAGLADDLAGLAATRLALRTGVRRSPLCRPRDHALALERVYRDLWQQWLARQ